MSRKPQMVVGFTPSKGVHMAWCYGKLQYGFTSAYVSKMASAQLRLLGKHLSEVGWTLMEKNCPPVKKATTAAGAAAARTAAARVAARTGAQGLGAAQGFRCCTRFGC